MAGPRIKAWANPESAKKNQKNSKGKAWKLLGYRVQPSHPFKQNERGAAKTRHGRGYDQKRNGHER